MLDKNRRYFERYPGDRERLVKIVEQLATTKVRLPGGDRLTPERLQVVGIEFGMAEGFERVHYLVEQAFFEDADRPVFSDAFLHGVEAVTSFHGEPLFAALHEPIYCQGTAVATGRRSGCATSSRSSTRPARTAPVHGRDDLPVDVRAAVPPAAAAGGGGAGGGALRLAGAV